MDPSSSHAIDDLARLRAFVAVVETGSFSKAGIRLNVVPSTISKHIAALEQRVLGQLIIRSTKGLSVTEIGQRFYGRCQAILFEVEQAETEIGQYKAEPQGVLKVSAATTFAQLHLMPIFAKFMAAHPKVNLEVLLSTTNEDLVVKGIDVAIRISNDLDPGLVRLKLAPNERVFCAAPDYLQAHGVPTRAEDMHQHNCLVIRGVTQSACWSIRNATGQFEEIYVAGRFASDNGDLVRRAVLAGMGIGHLPRFMAQEYLENGQLVEVFPESRTVASYIYAVYPERRNLPLKTRVFLDHLRTEFKTPPAWVK